MFCLNFLRNICLIWSPQNQTNIKGSNFEPMQIETKSREIQKRDKQKKYNRSQRFDRKQNGNQDEMSIRSN